MPWNTTKKRLIPFAFKATQYFTDTVFYKISVLLLQCKSAPWNLLLSTGTLELTQFQGLERLEITVKARVSTTFSRPRLSDKLKIFLSP